MIIRSSSKSSETWGMFATPTGVERYPSGTEPTRPCRSSRSPSLATSGVVASPRATVRRRTPLIFSFGVEREVRRSLRAPRMTRICALRGGLFATTFLARTCPSS